jgi:hypothetical protein
MKPLANDNSVHGAAVDLTDTKPELLQSTTPRRQQLRTRLDRSQVSSRSDLESHGRPH